jgi:hypothetical protein
MSRFAKIVFANQNSSRLCLAAVAKNHFNL